MNPKPIVAFCFLLLVLAGCSQGEGPGDDWRLDGGASDADRDDGQDVGPPPEPVETTIWLKNDTDSTLYVQTVEGCRVSPPAWVDWTSDGRPVDRCAICNCNRLDGDRRCRACPEACPIPTVQPVEPGTRVEWAWSGYRWVDDRIDSQNCERREIPDIGDQIRVDVCWGESRQGSPGQGGSVQDPTCSEVSFGYGTTDAGHTVEAEETGPPTFELTNRTDKAVRLMTPLDCQIDEREWISLDLSPHRAELRRAEVWSSCNQCRCESINDAGQCIVCGKACEGGDWKLLRAGETRSYAWEGVGWESSQRNGAQCISRVEPEVGQGLAARFCWTEQTVGVVEPEAMICTDIDFTYGSDRTVRYSIK